MLRISYVPHNAIVAASSYRVNTFGSFNNCLHVFCVFVRIKYELETRLTSYSILPKFINALYIHIGARTELGITACATKCKTTIAG